MDSQTRDNEHSAATDCSAEIDRGLFFWWKDHPGEAKDIAAKVVEFGVADTYVDELTFKTEPFCGVTVRVLVLWEMSESEPEFDVIIDRLRGVFGCRVDLWCCGTVKHLGDDV